MRRMHSRTSFVAFGDDQTLPLRVLTAWGACPKTWDQLGDRGVILAVSTRATGRLGSKKRVRTDSEETRAQILTAAIAEFSQHGFEGARVDAIAQRSSMNKQAIYYYFGSKDGLYSAALEKCYGIIRSFDAKISVDDKIPSENLSVLIKSFFYSVFINKEAIAIIAEENRLHGRHLKDGNSIGEINYPFFEKLKQVYNNGVEIGVFRKGVLAENLCIDILSLCGFYFSNSYTMSHILRLSLTDREVMAQRVEHVTTMLLMALRPEELALSG